MATAQSAISDVRLISDGNARCSERLKQISCLNIRYGLRIFSRRENTVMDEITPLTVTSPNVNNYHIGKGVVSFKEAGQPSYVDLGNSPSFIYSPQVTKKEHFSSRTGIKT